jgi:hypothetical protein
VIKSVQDYSVAVLLNSDNNVIYNIPRYQREYKWGKAQWENLFDDLLENDLGYFLGSIICINQSQDTIKEQHLELVDGQQRMTTLSLFLAALFASFQPFKSDMDEEQLADLFVLKQKLVMKKSSKMRLVPQAQNSNLVDYEAVLGLVGLVDVTETPTNAGNRRVFKAFRYFTDRIETFCDACEDGLVARYDLLERINQSVMVKIEVNSHSDAYVLFESLNNRGTPLTAIDLIKNNLLAEVGRKDPDKIEAMFDKWKVLLENLTDDYTTQERFFRQFYNAFIHEYREITSIPFATRSILITIYEKLISNDVFNFVDRVGNAGRIYSQIIGEKELDDEWDNLGKPLANLEHIQGASGYMLLMYLFLCKERLGIDSGNLDNIVNVLVKFFLRRNLTDSPPTRDVDRIFVSLISEIESAHGRDERGEEIVAIIRETLSSVSSSVANMKEALLGDLYLDNSAVARFVLCSLEEAEMTRESDKDLWKLDNHKKYVWTIEHIFPQGENIPVHWVDMIASGDKNKADSFRDQYVHKLGNLTISGFNSSLGTKSYAEKRDRTDKAGRAVGYKNGLSLNATLAERDIWKIEDIQERTEELAGKVVDMFAFKGELQ